MRPSTIPLPPARLLPLAAALLASPCAIAATLTGTVSSNGVLPGQQVDASSSAYFYLGPVNALENISSVLLSLGNTPANNVTYEFYVSSASLGAASWSLIGSATVSTSTAPVVSPGGSYSLGDAAWVKVTVPAATVCKMVHADITYNVP